MKKTLLISVLIVIVILILGGGIYYLVNKYLSEKSKMTANKWVSEQNQNTSTNTPFKDSFENLKNRVKIYLQAVSTGDWETAYSLEHPEYRTQISKKAYFTSFDTLRKEGSPTYTSAYYKNYSIGNISIVKAATKKDPTIIAKVEIILNNSQQATSLWIFNGEDWYHVFE